MLWWEVVPYQSGFRVFLAWFAQLILCSPFIESLVCWSYTSLVYDYRTACGKTGKRSQIKDNWHFPIFFRSVNHRV